MLFGASNFGDEIVQLIRDVNANATVPEWEIVGFLDDSAEAQGKIRNNVPVLGTREWISNNDITDTFFICCIGNPLVKAKIVDHLKELGAMFAKVIHPSVIISDTSVVGEGTVITAGNIITTNVRIKDHVIVNLACTIGHYTVIGNYCTINPGVNISGDVTLADGVLLGTNCTILEKRKIGDYSIVGAGAVVSKDLPSFVTAVGIPAKIIKENKHTN